MALIRDISATKKWLIENTLRQRYGEKVESQPADAGTGQQTSDRELSGSPAIDREREGCHFTIPGSGDENSRARFSCKGHQQYDTGVREYDDLGESASLLQAEADRETAGRDTRSMRL